MWVGVFPLQLPKFTLKLYSFIRIMILGNIFFSHPFFAKSSLGLWEGHPIQVRLPFFVQFASPLLVHLLTFCSMIYFIKFIYRFLFIHLSFCLFANRSF